MLIFITICNIPVVSRARVAESYFTCYVSMLSSTYTASSSLTIAYFVILIFQNEFTIENVETDKSKIMNITYRI